MEISLDVPIIEDFFRQALHVRVEIREGVLEADIGGGDRAVGPSEAELRSLIGRLQGYELEGEATLVKPRDLEVLVREESPFVGPSWRRRGPWPLEIEDRDQGLVYTLGPPSEHFVLFLLHRVRELGSDDHLFWRRPRRVLRARNDQRELLTPDDEEVPSYSLLNLLQDSLPRLSTLRIRAETDRSARQLQQFADAFAFQIAYNLDTAFVSVRSLDEVVRRTRLRRLRHVRPEELDPPRRTYGTDLVYHYQLAVATDSVPLEFLSYFHVAEHFFESVFEDDLIASVREMLTQPGFSFRRKQDVRGLVGLIRQRLRFQREDVTFSEQEALRLVLLRYVNLANVLDSLRSIQETLVVYYATNAVSFSKGDPVDLTGDDEQEIVAALARRIYRTRNAVVHSKEGGKPRYMPFRHDRELAQELPLMRLVAEEILVNSGSTLG